MRSPGAAVDTSRAVPRAGEPVGARELTGADLADPLERSLVVRARTDRHAFGELYDRTHGMIYRYCRRRLGERTAAEDACSAVFLAIAEQMPGFRGETDSDFRRWAFCIARNQTAALRRKTIRRRGLFSRAASSGQLRSPEATAPQPSTEADGLEAALQTLSERDQTLIDLRYTEAMSHEQIAEALGLRSGAVRTAISRALKKLRRQLEPDA